MRQPNGASTVRRRAAVGHRRPLHRSSRALGTSLSLAAVIGLLAAAPAFAHEVRQVGDYQFVVGFIEEPVFVGQRSGLEFSVSRNDEPVEGLAETLQAEVTKGTATRELPLSPRFGEPGWYASYFFPTEAGAYTFRIFGEIDGTPIDESFTAGPDTFGEVEAATSGQFPVQFPATGDLVDQAERGADAAGLMPLALGLAAAGLLVGLLAMGLALGSRNRG